MAVEVLKDNIGNTIAKITYDRNGDGVIKDFNGSILGYFYKKQNVTRDMNGQIIGTGNQLARLIK